MKKTHSSHILLGALVVILAISCSRKEDKFINRNWHALTTKYNTLYNGDVSFVEGKEALVETYQDNYWEQLPIERLEIREDVALQSEVSNPAFDRAEEKAAKAIQRHSMNIDDRERNSQIDEAFMLLGKARYFNQRFIRALEAFNYILYKYPTCNSINNARVWKAKTYIRLDNNESAIRSLKKILYREKVAMTEQELADASAMLAQAYVNLKHKDSAIAPMKVAAANTQINEEKGRYRYILGQLYNRERERDSANFEFDKIIKLNRRVPREYLINAYLAKARNLEIKSDDQVAFLDILTKLEKNWENRPFLDKIYYEKAIFFFGVDSLKIAEDYYKKSLATNIQDKYLRSLNYETLGRMKFDKGLFETSGRYMDSTLVLLDGNSKRYRVIKKKRDNLENIILYEGIVKSNDSILKIAALPEEERLSYFKKYTDSLIQIKRSEIKRQKSLKARSLQNNPTIAARSRVANSTDEQQFYFYNPITIANGKLQFEDIYGKRELVDNWKISSLHKFSQAAEAIEEVSDDYDIEKDPTFDPVQYVNKIPTEKKVLDSLKVDLNEAYFNLGTLYKEQLKAYDKSIDRFELLLANNPEERYIMPSKYNLYKIYQANGNTFREEQVRQDILQNHPDSRYAAIVKDPYKKADSEASSLESSYAKIYKRFLNQDYYEVLDQLEVKIKEYDGDPVVAKFQLLKALTLGKIYGPTKMRELLGYLSITYPRQKEGKKAQILMDNTVPYLENLVFTEDKEGTKKYKLVYDYIVTDNERALNFKSRLDTLIKKRNFNYLKTSIDFYSKDTLFLVVHGLKGRPQVRGMNSIVTDTEKKGGLGVERDGLFITTDNYRVLQSQKKYRDYLKIKDSLYY